MKKLKTDGNRFICSDTTVSCAIHCISGMKESGPGLERVQDLRLFFSFDYK